MTHDWPSNLGLDPGAVTALEKDHEAIPALANWIEGVDFIQAGRAEGIAAVILPVFHREFFPRFDRPTPPEVRRMLHSLAQERFGRLYLPDRGIVRFDPPPVLQEPLRPLPENRRRDPHVEFFRRANPGHEQGDELVCLAEFAPWNFTRVAQRIIAASFQPAAPEAVAG